MNQNEEDIGYLAGVAILIVFFAFPVSFFAFLVALPILILVKLLF